MKRHSEEGDSTVITSSKSVIDEGSLSDMGLKDDELMPEPTLHFVAEEAISAQLWSPVMEEAQRRGLRCTFSSNPAFRADIGFYCDDKSQPGSQSLTIISPNGIDQIHDVTSDPSKFFLRENWGLFDLGLLPGQNWASLYLEASNDPRCRPTFGSILSGWPKSDHLFPANIDQSVRLKGIHQRRVLYAPNIECDGKQGEVVRALTGQDMRLLIKHWETQEDSAKYPGLLTPSYLANLSVENEKVSELEWVTILPNLANFVDFISQSDVLISDQSSVLAEALLCGVPAISVIDWLHNCGSECTPNGMEVCVSASRNSLGKSVEQVFENYAYYAQLALGLRAKNFANLGVSSSVVLDAALAAWYMKTKTLGDLPLLCLDALQQDRYDRVNADLHNMRLENRRLRIQNQAIRQVGNVDNSRLFKALKKLYKVRPSKL